MCFKTSKDRRKLSLAIARAKEALSASCRVALPVLPGQLRVQALSAWTPNMGGKRGRWQCLFLQVLVFGKSSVNLYSVVSRTTDETPWPRLEPFSTGFSRRSHWAPHLDLLLGVT